MPLDLHSGEALLAATYLGALAVLGLWGVHRIAFLLIEPGGQHFHRLRLVLVL